MPRRIRIAVLVVLLIAAGALAVVAWQQQQDDDELARRYDCPTDLAGPLPGGPAPALEASDIRLEEVTALDALTAITFHPITGAPFVTERDGRVLRLGDGAAEVVRNLSDQVSTAGEQGLLGLAFSPNGELLYLDYTDADGHTVVVAHEVEDSMHLAPRPQTILFVEQPHRWHNAGDLAFDDEGLLYVTLGDGGGQADPWDNGQDLSEPLGSILRIEPRPGSEQGHAVPPDNPFVDVDDADPRIWAYGLRNPWRISIDNGTLYIADAGDGCFEEINIRPISEGGANFGWDRVEGPWAIDPAPDDHVAPAYTYSRTDGACAVIGGFVYGGNLLPELAGRYLFADHCRGEVMALDPATGEVVPTGVGVPTVTGFGEDLDGEPWLVTLTGGVYRMAPASP